MHESNGPMSRDRRFWSDVVKRGVALRSGLAGILLWLFLSADISSAQTKNAPVAASRSSPAERFSVAAEPLVWWTKKSPAPPPLVSTGVLGQPGTKTLLGGEELDMPEHPGVRLTVAGRATERWSVEAAVFYLPSRWQSRSVGSSGEIGSRDLSIPFFDVTLPGEDVTGLSRAGQFSGRATEEWSSRLIGAELEGARDLGSTERFGWEFLGGFRYLNLRETLSFATTSPNVPPRPADIFQTKDRFDTRNNFYGTQTGLRVRSVSGPLTLTGSFKLAMGAMVQSVNVDGFLLTNDFNGLGEPERFPGGYFAQPTNMGERTRTVFAIVPDLGLNVGYMVARRTTLLLGYTFLYMNRVVRPGKQVDRRINPTQNPSVGPPPPATLVGPAKPAPRADGSGFWAQGVSLGFEFRF